MPILQGNNDEMLRLAFGMIQAAQQRRAQQGANLINTAAPGATVGGTGMDPKIFAELFGKNTTFDPARVLKPETSATMTDKLTQDYLRGLNPMQQLDIVATNLQNQAGVAGVTTMKGLDASRKTNEANAVSKQHTAESVAEMIDTGIAQMKKASPEIQGRIGQQAGFGTTADQQEADLKSNQLKIAALKEAIGAQTNPNAPIHKFLGTIGLDLPTVLASVAMGTTNLLDSYSRVWAGSKQAGFDEAAALRKAEIETAKDLSQKTFGGKLNVRQTLALMDAQSTGKVPKGLEGAFDVYSRGVAAAYNSAMSELMTKNDPFLKATADQIQALTKPGVDPNTIEAVNELSTRAAGYAVTLQQFNGQVPNDAAGLAAFNRAMAYNTAKVPKGGVHFPWTAIHRDQAPSGLATPGFPQGGPGSAAPTDGAVTPVRPISGISPAGQVPAGLLTNQSGQDISKAPPPLSQDQNEAIMRYIRSIQMNNPTIPGAP